MEKNNIEKRGIGKGLEALVSLESDAPTTSDKIFNEIVKLEKIDKIEFNKLIERIKNKWLNGQSSDSQEGTEQS